MVSDFTLKLLCKFNKVNDIIPKIISFKYIHRLDRIKLD